MGSKENSLWWNDRQGNFACNMHTHCSKPFCFRKTDRYSHVQSQIKSNAWAFTSFPVIDEENKLIGLLTRDEMDFVEGTNPTVEEIMKKR